MALTMLIVASTAMMPAATRVITGISAPPAAPSRLRERHKARQEHLCLGLHDNFALPDPPASETPVTEVAAPAG